MRPDSHRSALALVLAAAVVLGPGALAASAPATAQPTATAPAASDVDAGVADDAAAATPNHSENGTNHSVNGTAIRALHVSTLLPPIDVLVDGDPVLTNVSFVGVTSYRAVEPGNATVQVRLNESGDVIYDENVTFAANTTYTLLGTANVTADDETEYAPALLADDVDAPSEENASLRFVHAITDAPPVVVTLQPVNETVGENVTSRNASNYTTVPAGNYTLTVAPADAVALGERVLTRNVTLDGGTAYTVVAFGFLDAQAVPEAFPLLVVLTVDRNATVPVPIEGNGSENGAATGNETNTANDATAATVARTPVARTPVDGR